MRATLVEQEHRIMLKITEARVSLQQQISPSEVALQIEFLATHYCKKETQVIEDEEQEVETTTPFQQSIVYDTITQNVPFDLWVGLVKAADTPELLPTINVALEAFNVFFVNSMTGFELQIQSIAMG